MSQGLYREDGTFVPFEREELLCEIANRQSALSFGDAWFGQLADPDPILRKMGEDSKILNDLLADDQVITATTGRKNRVLNAPDYGFTLATLDGVEPNAKQKLVHERFMQDFERLNLRSIINSILDAPFFGMTPLEIIWEASAGWWHIKDIVARPYYWFGFDNKNVPFFKGDKFRHAEQKPLPVGKFVMVTHNATYDNPYGMRLLSRCLWPVSFKRGGTKFYAKFIEKYGLPWVIGKAPRGANPDEKRSIAVNLARMVEDAVAVIPQGSEVQLVSPSGQESSMHEAFLSRQDRSISKILMGQTLTVEMEGKNNSQAAATTHQDVASGIAESDKAMVIDAMNEFAWLYTQLNAGPSVLAPVFSYNEPKDLQERVKLDKELFGLGVRFTSTHFSEEYGLKEGEFTLTTEQNSSPQDTPPQKEEEKESTKGQDKEEKETKEEKEEEAAFSAPIKNTFREQIKNQTAFDAVLKERLPKAIKANEAFVNTLLSEIDKAESFDDIELILIRHLGANVEMSELENILATSMTEAASFGAYSVQKEIGKEDEGQNA